jgi:hypothetical protein
MIVIPLSDWLAKRSGQKGLSYLRDDETLAIVNARTSPNCGVPDGRWLDDFATCAIIRYYI